MLEQVKAILVESANVDGDKVTLEASLRDDLGLDSLDAVELVLELETQFDVKIEDDEMQKLETVKDIIELVESKK